MIDFTYPVLISIVVVVVCSLFLARRGKSVTQTIKGYFWGNQDFKAPHLAQLFLSTAFSFNGMLYQTWLGYSIGWSALWLQVIWCISYLWMARYATRVRELSTNGTLHGSIGATFGVGAEKAASVASIIGFTLQVGWEVAVGVMTLKLLLPNNPGLTEVLSICLATIAAIYTIQGGLRGNLKANIGQNICGILTLILAVVLIFTTKASIGPINTPNWIETHKLLITSMGIIGFSTNAIFSIFWQFVDMSNWENIAASGEDPKTPKRGLIQGMIWVFLFPGVIGTIAGVGLSGVSNLTSNNILSQWISLISQHNSFIAMLVLMGFVAAMLSTLDGLLLAAAQAITWDLTERKSVVEILKYKDKENEKPEEVILLERKVLLKSQIAVLVVAIVGSVGIAVGLQHFPIFNLFNLVYLVTIAQISLVPVVFQVLRKKGGNGFISIIAGLSTGLICVVWALYSNSDYWLNGAAIVGLLFAWLGLLVPRKRFVKTTTA